MDNTMVQVAKLDHDLIYWGLEARALRDLKSGDLVFCPRAVWAQAIATPALMSDEFEGARWVEEECDLPGGAYRWDAALGRFEPLPTAQRKSTAEAPTLEQAFYDLVTSGPTAPRVVAWAAWFKQTMDERKKT